MKKNNNIWLFIFGIGVILAIVLFLVIPGNNEQQYKNTRPVNWSEDYHENQKSPYGAYIFSRLLEKYYEDQGYKKVKYKEYKEHRYDKPGKKYILFRINDQNEFDYEEKDIIFNFVESGNYVFIASEKFGEHLNSILETQYIRKVRFKKQDVHRFNFNEQREKRFAQFYFYEKGIKEHNWISYLPITDLDTSEAFSPPSMPLPVKYAQIGDITPYTWNESGNSVFLKIKYGAGAFFLHATPSAFSNISLLQEQNVEYLEKILSFLPEGNLIWQDVTNYSEDERKPNSKRVRRKESPLMFILSEPSLKWAYYLLLITILVYVLFRMKRRHRVIPGIPRNENSAVEFADTLSKLYFERGKHVNLVKHKEKLLYHFIRGRYFIYTRNNDPKFIPLLAVKSNLPNDRLNRMFALYEHALAQSEISDEELMEIHSLTDYFYKNCK